MGVWGLDLCSRRVVRVVEIFVALSSHCRRNSVPMGKVARRIILSCPSFSSDVAVTMVEAAKRVVFDRVKVSKLEEVSYEMLVLTLPHVSSCVSVAFL